MSIKKQSNYRLFISDDAFRSIVEGVAALSIKNSKLETPTSLVEYAILNDITPSEAEISSYRIISTDGDIRIHFNLASTLKDAFEALRSNLSSATGDAWSVRDTFVLIALTLAQRFSGLR